jgi:4-amino-4-deoxy-L-arabinose transferase-like glycosyltransferase
VRRPVLTLLILAVLTSMLGLGRQAITDSDEAYYAEASREMVESGDWLTPRFNYRERFEKPALYYWLTAATYRISGPFEWAARLWSALSGVGLALLTYAAARRMFDRHDTAWLAGAIVATCFGCFTEARLALPDLPLTFCITLGIWAGLRAGDVSRRDALRDARRWWALAGLGAGLGFLMKGPVALVIPGIVLLPIWWRERKTIALPRQGLAIAALVFAVVGLPWYVAMWAEHGSPYLASFFLADNLERFATARFNEPRGVWFYVPILIGGMMPWSAFLVGLPARSIADVARGRRRLEGTEWRLLLWATMPLLFYTASVGKQPRYILPVLAPIAILLARSIMRRIDEARTSGTAAPALRASTWITAATFAGVALLFARTRHVFINVDPSASWMALTVTGIAALAVGWMAFSRAWSRLPIVAALAGAAVLLSVQFGALAGVRPEAVEQMVALVGAHRTAGQRVGQYQVFVRNLVFYARFPQVTLVDETVAPFVQSPDPVLLVVLAEDVPRIEEQSGTTLRELGRVQYFNAANIRPRTFLRPDPAEEIQTVLLVTNR